MQASDRNNDVLIKQPCNNSFEQLFRHDYLTKSIETRAQRRVLQEAYSQECKRLRQSKLPFGGNSNSLNNLGKGTPNTTQYSDEGNSEARGAYAGMYDKLNMLRKANVDLIKTAYAENSPVQTHKNWYTIGKEKYKSVRHSHELPHFRQ